MSSTDSGGSRDEGIIDVERRKTSVEYTLGDPTIFPPEFLVWLKRFIESSGLTLPASTIFGTFNAGSGATKIGTTIAELGATTPGKAGLIRAGPSPYDFLTVVYDGAYAKWVSPIHFAQEVQHANSNTAGVWQDAGAAQQGVQGILMPDKPFVDAGLTLQWRLLGLLYSSAASTSSIGARAVPVALGGAVGTPTGDLTLASVTNNAGAVAVDSGWQNVPGHSAAAFVRLVIRFHNNVNNTGGFQVGTLLYRWVA